MDYSVASKYRAWERQAEIEYSFICNEIIKRFWDVKFFTICSSHSFINEFELQNEIVSFSLIKDFFLREFPSVIETSKIEFSHKYSSNGEITFCFRFPSYGLQETYVSKINLQLTKKALILWIDPVNSSYKKLDLLEYKSVLRIIEDLLVLDLEEVSHTIKNIVSTYWITEKNAELAACSIRNVCNGILGTTSIKYRVDNYALVSVLKYEELPNKWKQKLFIHKEFCENPKVVADYLQTIIEKENYEKK